MLEVGAIYHWTDTYGGEDITGTVTILSDNLAQIDYYDGSSESCEVCTIEAWLYRYASITLRGGNITTRIDRVK